TLFILYENRLAGYRRERDSDSGWLTYLWKLDLSNLNRQLELEAKKLLKNLKTKLEYEEDKVFYICKNLDGRFLFEIAAEMEFKCPFCGNELIFEENEPVIEALKQRIVQLEDLTSSSGAVA
ncbi:MAG TPA: transcription factor, partial [Candidatus Methanoperedens sp.]|nr:transcription factor [Candidatus Methanoperedens sp.]